MDRCRVAQLRELPRNRRRTGIGLQTSGRRRFPPDQFPDESVSPIPDRRGPSGPSGWSGHSGGSSGYVPGLWEVILLLALSGRFRLGTAWRSWPETVWAAHEAAPLAGLSAAQPQVPAAGFLRVLDLLPDDTGRPEGLPRQSVQHRRGHQDVLLLCRHFETGADRDLGPRAAIGSHTRFLVPLPLSVWCASGHCIAAQSTQDQAKYRKLH